MSTAVRSCLAPTAPFGPLQPCIQRGTAAGSEGPVMLPFLSRGPTPEATVTSAAHGVPNIGPIATEEVRCSRG
jgi:hypothetical protein